MKFYKKISLLISLVMLCTIIPDFANAKGNTTVDDSFKLKLLESLNILSVSDLNSDFSVESKVTRGQFAVYVARLMNVLTDDSSGDVLFQDVPKSHYAFGATKILAESNIIHGSGGLFYPDDYITYEQAIKMVVSALGYSIAADAKGGYPYGYSSVATDVGLTDGIATIQGRELTKIDAVRLIFNSLSIGQMAISVYGKNPSFAPDANTTFLSMRDIKEYIGQVVSNEMISISGSGTAPTDSVKIGDYYFRCGETNISEYLGQVVSIYYSVDSNNIYTVMFVEQSYSDVIDIPAADIEEFKDWQYTYKISGSSKRVRISDSCNIIYNGKVPIYFNTGYMTPDAGRVRIISNKETNSEDLVIITNVEDYMITSADENEYTLYSENKLPKSLNAKKVVVYSANGNVVPFDAIKEGDIVSVAESDDGTSAVLYISDKTVIGKVSTIENETGYSRIVIGSTGYRVLTGTCVVPKVNEKVILHLNSFGDVGYIEDEVDDTVLFGYIIKSKKIRKEDAVLLEILTQKGEIGKFYVANKVRINDKSYKNDPDGVITEIDTLIAAEQRVIKYELNSDKKIKTLYVYDATNKNYIHDLKFTTTALHKKYNSQQQTFDGEVTLSDKAIVFTTHNDIYEMEARTKSTFSNDSTYIVTCFSFGDTPFADVVVLDEKQPGTHRYMAVVQKVVTVFDEEDEETKTEITVLMEGKEQSFVFEQDTDVYTFDSSGNEVIEGKISVVNKGDVIRIEISKTTNAVGRILHIYNKAGNSYLLKVNPYVNANAYFSEKRVMYADVVSNKKGLLRIKPVVDSGFTNTSTTEENCLTSKFFIYKYDDTEKKWKIGKSSDILINSKLLVGTNYGDPMEIIILN